MNRPNDILAAIPSARIEINFHEGLRDFRAFPCMVERGLDVCLIFVSGVAFRFDKVLTRVMTGAGDTLLGVTGVLTGGAAVIAGGALAGSCATTGAGTKAAAD